MKLNTQGLRKAIATAIPDGVVVAAHTDKEHFYRVTNIEPQPVYPSVTGKLQCLKDPSLKNFAMNESLRYVFGHFKEFTDANIMEQLDIASKTSTEIRDEAGDVGSEIHAARERYFRAWIAAGTRPEVGAVGFVDEDMGIKDVRVISAMRALDKFVADFDYEPVATELLLYSHKLKLGGALDDIGWVSITIRAGAYNCTHDMIGLHCAKCDLKKKRVLALVDLKSSNQIKFYYGYQVALYYAMFRELTGIKLDKFYILKVSKEDGTYKLQEIKKMPAIVRYAKHVLKVNDGNELIAGLFEKPKYKLE